MTHETESERLGRLYLSLFNERSLETLDELLHPDFTSHLRIGEVRGVERFRALMESFYRAFPDAKWTVDEWLFLEDRVVLRYHWEGTQAEPFLGIPVSTVRVRTEGLELLHLEGGRIREVWNYSDLMGLAAQLHAPNPLSLET